MFAAMIRPKTCLTLLVLFASTAWGWADVDTSRFSEIVERNPFRLKDPPPPVTNEPQVPPPPPAPLATVELTGITGLGILATKRALLEIIPGPGKQMIKPVLAEGEKIESVEVVSIDVDKNEVVIRNGTLVTNLTFKVAKSTTAPPPANMATPGMPGRPVAPPILPGTPQANAGQPSYNYSQTSGRSGVIMTGGAAPTYQESAVTSVQPGGTVGTPLQNNLNSQSPFRSIPQRSIRSGLPQQQPNAQQPITPEVSVIEVENNTKMNPHLPFPPTVLNPQFPPFPGQVQPQPK
jgi:hypothetical protein